MMSLETILAEKMNEIPGHVQIFLSMERNGQICKHQVTYLSWSRSGSTCNVPVLEELLVTIFSIIVDLIVTE